MGGAKAEKPRKDLPLKMIILPGGGHKLRFMPTAFFITFW